MFPEDCRVAKDRLIWMWIAEGFIQCGKQRKGLFELRESYFNELINRSMIQPIYDFYEMVYGCHVHDMVLDLICSLSIEANFVTTLNGMDQMPPLSMIRRISIQNSKEDSSMTLAHTSLQQVRSVIVLRFATSQILDIRNFQVLRVLDLRSCDLSKGYNINKCLGNQVHMRYLGLCDTCITQLPEEIGNLQFLQMLDTRGNDISCLPSSVVQLKHLMCLEIDWSTRAPNGIGSLTSLEKLLCLGVDDTNIDILEELGQLTELRVLGIKLNKWNDKLVECLRKLEKIQDLTVMIPFSIWNISGLDAWLAPRCLRHLQTEWGGFWFSRLPAWMSPSHLPCLSILSITIREIQQGDLNTLGNLHALRSLDLTVGHGDLGILGEFVIGAGSFPCLVYCEFGGFVTPVMFQQGAMPRLRTLHYGFSVRGAIEIRSSDGVLDLGLGLLPSLQEIEVWLDSQGASEEEEEGLKVMLWHASKIHPNHPSVLIGGISEDEDSD